MRYLECFVPDLVSIVNLVCNHCNNQYMDFGDNMEDHVRYISSTKHTAAVIFFSLVCSNGEALPLFYLMVATTWNANGYINAMTLTIIPWMRKVARRNLVSSRMGAPPTQPTRCKPSSKKLTFGPSQCGIPRARTLTHWTTVCDGKWRVVCVRLSHRMSQS